MPIEQLREEQSPGEVFSSAYGFPAIPGLAGKLVPADKVRDLYRRMQQFSDGFRLENLLAEMHITLQVDPADIARVPGTGPVVVVANHPFGVLDGMILTVLLTRVRPDVKVMTNLLLADVPELRRHSIFVDPFQSDRYVDSNRRSVKLMLGSIGQGCS